MCQLAPELEERTTIQARPGFTHDEDGAGTKRRQVKNTLEGSLGEFCARLARRQKCRRTQQGMAATISAMRDPGQNRNQEKMPTEPATIPRNAHNALPHDEGEATMNRRFRRRGRPPREPAGEEN